MLKQEDENYVYFDSHSDTVGMLAGKLGVNMLFHHVLLQYSLPLSLSSQKCRLLLSMMTYRSVQKHWTESLLPTSVFSKMEFL